MYSDKNDLLTKAKDLLKEEMTTISYTTWIKSLEIESINDNKIVCHKIQYHNPTSLLTIYKYNILAAHLKTKLAGYLKIITVLRLVQMRVQNEKTFGKKSSLFYFVK